MSHKAVIFLAPGFEELEALAPIDVFRRAGVPTTTCAVAADGGAVVTSTHGVKIQCDCTLQELDPSQYTLTYFPGGMPGATNLAVSEGVLQCAKAVYAAGGICCAICAAPIALDAAGLLDGAEYTCYPGFEAHISSGKYTGKYIQKSGRILTACGPAAALDFSLEILRNLGMSALVKSLADGMLINR